VLAHRVPRSSMKIGVLLGSPSCLCSFAQAGIAPIMAVPKIDGQHFVFSTHRLLTAKPESFPRLRCSNGSR
jgi:hypothetical protein